MALHGWESVGPREGATYGRERLVSKLGKWRGAGVVWERPYAWRGFWSPLMLRPQRPCSHPRDPAYVASPAAQRASWGPLRSCGPRRPARTTSYPAHVAAPAALRAFRGGRRDQKLVTLHVASPAALRASQCAPPVLRSQRPSAQHRAPCFPCGPRPPARIATHPAHVAAPAALRAFRVGGATKS